MPDVARVDGPVGTRRGASVAEDVVAPPRLEPDGLPVADLGQGRVTLPFKEIPGGEFSGTASCSTTGVDMASFCGAPVSAAHDGVVLAAGRHFDDFIGWVGDLAPYYARLDAKHLVGRACRSSWSSMTATATAASTPTSAT